MARLRIGSRGSQLALWQANHISSLLRDRGHEVEIEIIKTTGDKILDVALAKVGTKGMFTKEIEEALLDKRVDLAVHSLRIFLPNLPMNSRLRQSPCARIRCDAFLCRHFDSIADLPQKAPCRYKQPAPSGTTQSHARGSQVFPLRGNVDTACESSKKANMTPLFLRPPDLIVSA